MSAQQFAPFPYTGGKARVAAQVWKRFGRLDRYIEPFCGSAGVLLSKSVDPKRMEIIGDLNGYVANTWRAIQADPDAVAFHAEWPSIHADLLARHRWLVAWGRNGALARLCSDPDWYDVRAAGWWMWGVSNWITTSDFCSAAFKEKKIRESIPHIEHSPAGMGVQASKVGDGPEVTDRRPHVKSHTGGQGVQLSRRATPEVVDSIPRVADRVGGHGVQATKVENVEDYIPTVSPSGHGWGVQAQRRGIPDFIPHVKDHRGGSGVQSSKVSDIIPSITHQTGGRGIQTSKVAGDPEKAWKRGERWKPWMRALSARLARVTILARPWESCVKSRSVLGIVASNLTTGVFLDPPYKTGNRDENLYAEERNSDEVAQAVFDWAVENGSNPRLRIAVCAMEGDFDPPKGWVVHTWKSTNASNKKNEVVLFSPHCVGKAPTLF